MVILPTGDAVGRNRCALTVIGCGDQQGTGADGRTLHINLNCYQILQ
nr:hypothetical protein JVH1_0900 [Rhodococcus sp. JVH1]